MAESPTSSTTYRDAGVDIEAGDALVDRIKPAVKRSMRREVLGGWIAPVILSIPLAAATRSGAVRAQAVPEIPTPAPTPPSTCSLPARWGSPAWRSRHRPCTR